MRYFIFLFLLSFQAFAAPRPIEVHGHRGARGYYPENTLPAFAHALKVGVDILEFDTGITKDNKVIISHDGIINPAICLDKTGKPLKTDVVIRNTNLKELKELDCGSLKNSDFQKQTVVPKTSMPTLDEFFDFIKNSEDPAAKTVRFNIETKIDPARPEIYAPPETFVRLLYEVIKKHNMQKRVILQSFDPRTLREMKKLDSNIILSLLLEKEPPDLTKVIDEYQPQIISPYFEWLKEKHINELKKLNVQVAPWTANKESQWKKLVKLGVNGIITDYPDDLIKYLDKK